MFTGTYFGRATNASLERIRLKLQETLPLFDVTDVIVGWNTDEAHNSAILDSIHAHGKKAWLWMPVFSEAPSSENPDPQIGFSTTPNTRQRSGDEEDFTFICPSSPYNQGIALRLYDRFFSRLPFDGVFLDKIRQSSFACGLERAIGCLCPLCRQYYLSAGVDPDDVLGCLADNLASLLPVNRQGAQYRFSDPDMDAFFAAKAGLITGAVSSLADAFRERGLMVGLDVFAPLVAWYVGQDIPTLAETADFVKPMFYLRTNSPAGMPFELRSVSDVVGPGTQAALHALWGAASTDAAGCAKAQMAALTGAKSPIWPGFEVNLVPDICDTNPAYVREMVKLYEDAGAEKVVLSWNLLYDTGDNLTALARP